MVKNLMLSKFKRDKIYDNGLDVANCSMKRYPVADKDYLNRFACYNCDDGVLIFDALTGKQLLDYDPSGVKEPTKRTLPSKSRDRKQEMLDIISRDHNMQDLWPSKSKKRENKPPKVWDQSRVAILSDYTELPLQLHVEYRPRVLSSLIPFTFGIMELEFVRMKFGCTKCGEYFQSKWVENGKDFSVHFDNCKEKIYDGVVPVSVENCLAQASPTDGKYVMVFGRTSMEHGEIQVKFEPTFAPLSEKCTLRTICKEVAHSNKLSYWNDDHLVHIGNILKRNNTISLCAVWNYRHRVEVASAMMMLSNQRKLAPALFIVSNEALKTKLEGERLGGRGTEVMTVRELPIHASPKRISQFKFQRIVWVAPEPHSSQRVKTLSYLESLSPACSFVCFGFSRGFVNHLSDDEYRSFSRVPHNVEIIVEQFHSERFSKFYVQTSMLLANENLKNRMLVVTSGELHWEFEIELKRLGIKFNKDNKVRCNSLKTLYVVDSRYIDQVDETLEYQCVICYRLCDEDCLKSMSFLQDFGPLQYGSSSLVERSRRAILFYTESGLDDAIHQLYIGTATRKIGDESFFTHPQQQCVRARANLLLGDPNPEACTVVEEPCSVCAKFELLNQPDRLKF